MANIHYHLIDTPTLEVDGNFYDVSTYRMDLKDFLLAHTGSQIYIYRPSLDSHLETGELHAFVI
jgi:hypothetical protein